MIVNKFLGTKVTAELLNPSHSDFYPACDETPPAEPHLVMVSVNAGTSYMG